VGGHPLVQVDQIVDLRAGAPSPLPDQRVEPVPLGAVRRDEDVDIHRCSRPGEKSRSERAD
jgi:hypothetical protein